MAPGAKAEEQAGKTIDAGGVSFSIVDREDGTHWWRRSNKEFRTETVQVDPAGRLAIYLFLTERIVDTHIGLPGSKSRLKITAYPLSETQVGAPIWSFEAEGDVWKLEGSRIAVTKFGCCDEPDRISHFSVSDGRAAK